MAAVAHASPADLRPLVLVRTRPVVRPVSSGSPATVYRRQRAAVLVYRRRRAAALVVLTAAVAAVVLALQSLLVGLEGRPVTPSERPETPAAVYVVQPGDTFWDIARRLHPGDDPRPLVTRMVAAHGSAALVAGERLPLPGAA